MNSDQSIGGEKQRALCFTFWFRTHNNCRYAVLFSQLAHIVKFHKVTLSEHRIVRGLQYLALQLSFARRLLPVGQANFALEFAEFLLERLKLRVLPRQVRDQEFGLGMALRRKVIYPEMARYFASRYPTVFTVDIHQIPVWPASQRVVVDIDDPYFAPAEIEILKLPQVRAIVVTTEQARKLYQQQGVTCPIHVIPQGVSFEHIDPNRIGEIRTQFKGDRDVVVGYHAPTLTMSSDGPRRARTGQDDLDFLFAAVEDARTVEPRIKLWLIGQPSESVKTYVAERRAFWIKMFGYLPVMDILNYVSNFDIGVYPRTRIQPPGRFNLKLAQYMACGVSVVSNELDESLIVRQAHCGLVCRSREDFSQVLVELARCPEKRAELANVGRTYAQTNLDWSVLLPIYKEILMG